MTTSPDEKPEELKNGIVFEPKCVGFDSYLVCVRDAAVERSGYYSKDQAKRLVELLNAREETIDELECTLEDEEAAHLGTLRMIDAATTHSVEMVAIAKQWSSGEYDRQPGLRATHQFRLAKYAADWILERERKNA